MSTLYVLKDGRHEALSRDTIRNIKQIDQIKKVKQAAYRQTRAMKALAGWLLTIQRKGLRLDAKDMVLTRLPNIDRLLSMCDETSAALEELRDA